ncbi:MAG: hypothetical protein JSS04_17095 [Proteobacteria bacterium]|nr:hypothetical protein [Pseudomonadota bacterium]
MADNDRQGGDRASSAHIADIGPALKQEASRLADKSVSSGVEAADAVGKAAESAAQALDESLPALAGYVRNAAQYTERLADDLRDKKAGDLLSTAITWSRQQPLIALAGAAVLGFALSRLAKAGLAETATAAHADGDGHAR